MARTFNSIQGVRDRRCQGKSNDRACVTLHVAHRQGWRWHDEWREGESCFRLETQNASLARIRQDKRKGLYRFHVAAFDQRNYHWLDGFERTEDQRAALRHIVCACARSPVACRKFHRSRSVAVAQAVNGQLKCS